MGLKERRQRQKETLRGGMLVATREIAKDTWAKVTLAWGAFHGLVALAMAGRLRGSRDEAMNLTDRAARDLLSAWLAAQREDTPFLSIT